MNKVQKTLLVEAKNNIETDPVYARELLNEVLSAEEEDKVELKKLGIKELKRSLTLEDIKNHAPWLLKAKIKDAVLSYDVNFMVISWDGGTWEDGTWEDDQVRWKDGTWKKGVWKGGTWEGGTWLNGTWENGYWEGGTWKNGTWKDGYWLNYLDNSVWEKGTWKDGLWNGGVWLQGIWEKGLWQDGTWKTGTWETGEIWNKAIKGYKKSTEPPK